VYTVGFYNFYTGLPNIFSRVYNDMAFTRFHDDPYRIKKQLEESSGPSRYILNKPGQGVNLPFMEDPQMRLQGWGANLRTNTVNLESDLFGMTRPLNRDLVTVNDYKSNSVNTSVVSYPVAEPFVQESRASHPAWMYKDLEQPRWEAPYLNPLNGLEKGFNENIQTRILEKDYYAPAPSRDVMSEWTSCLDR
jgi:hypothetical protein